MMRNELPVRGWLTGMLGVVPAFVRQAVRSLERFASVSRQPGPNQALIP